MKPDKGNKSNENQDTNTPGYVIDIEGEVEDGDVIVNEDGIKDVSQMSIQDLNAMIAKAMQESLAPVINQMDTQFKAINERIDLHEKRLERLEALPQSAAAAVQAIEQVRETNANKPGALDSALDMTFGTAGKVLHGVLDTASYLGSCVIDLATLGRAKRKGAI